MGGGPPARSPHASLRLGVIDLEARPGPAAAHGHRSQAHQSLRRPPHQWGLVCWRVAWRVGSRPALAPPPPTGTAAWPRSLGRPPHRRRLVADVWLGASARSPARPSRRPRALQPGSPDPPNAVWLVVLGFWGAPLCVVTNVVNRRCFSCGFLIRCYKRRQSEGFFAENQGFWTQIDDVCNMSTRKEVQTAPV